MSDETPPRTFGTVIDRLEVSRNELAEDIRRFKILNGTVYQSAGDGLAYRVSNLHADGRMTLARLEPKVRGKHARKAEKRARHAAATRHTARGHMNMTALLSSFSLGNVQVLGSDPACLAFRRTVDLNQVGVVPGALRLRSRGAENWPAVSIDGGEPSQAGTLWVFLLINGAWYATGAERLRPNQTNGEKPEGSPTDLIGTGWLYDRNRWGVMSGYNPQPGEPVGLMIVSGSTRSDNQQTVRERSNVLICAWPGASGADPLTVLYDERSEQPAPPPPEPPPPVPPPPPPADDLIARLTRLEQKVDGIAGLLEHFEGLIKQADDRADARAAELEQQLAAHLAPTYAGNVKIPYVGNAPITLTPNK